MSQQFASRIVAVIFSPLPCISLPVRCAFRVCWSTFFGGRCRLHTLPRSEFWRHVLVPQPWVGWHLRFSNRQDALRLGGRRECKVLEGQPLSAYSCVLCRCSTSVPGGRCYDACGGVLQRSHGAPFALCTTAVGFAMSCESFVCTPERCSGSSIVVACLLSSMLSLAGSDTQG